jgi:hypothetical protein
VKKLILLIFVVAASLNAQAVQGQIGQVPVVAAADNRPVGGAGNLTTVGAVPYVSATGTLSQAPTQFFWDATNNRLGIGTATPSAKLDVTGTSSATPSNLLNLTQDYTGGVLGAAFNGIVENFTGTLPNAQVKFIDMQNAGVTKFSFGGNSGSTNMFFKRYNTTAGYTFITGATNLDNLQIYGTNTSNPFTIEPAGNVGIGTATPVSKLDITDTLNVTGPVLSIRNTNVNAPHPQFNMDFYGYAGTPAAMFSALSIEPAYAGVAGAYVSFNTKLQPQSTAVTAMTILGGGNVGIGTITPWSLLSVNGRASANLFGSETNCSSSAGPAVCAAAAAGSVIIPAAGTDVTVNTTAVTANSQIFAIFDQSLGTKLGVTCNSTTANPHIGARVAGTSFTIHANVSPITNPACFSYFIIN